jgi:benzylsuccinate CoA-transferase BbsE subunit
MNNDRPYSGITVLDLTHDLGSYATRLFADLGAEVIRIEPPGGAPDRTRAQALPEGEARRAAQYAFAFRNASKSSVIVDPQSAEGQERAAAYLRRAQLIFLERDGLFADRLDWVRSLNPSAVITYVSPYGLDGPRANWKSNDLTLQAAGGITWLSGRPGEPPLRLPADQSAMITSTYAAVATAAALFDAETTGQGHVIDVAGQECIAHSLQNALQVYDLEGVISSRGGEGTRDAAEVILGCKDGRMLVASPLGLGPSWHSLIAWIKETGHPAGDTLAQPRWLDSRWRKTLEAQQEFRDAFAGFIAGYTKKEIMDQALTRKIVMSPVSRIHDILADEQLAHRGYFVPVAGCGVDRAVTFPGAPYQFSEPVWAVAPPPPAVAN